MSLRSKYIIKNSHDNELDLEELKLENSELQSELQEAKQSLNKIHGSRAYSVYRKLRTIGGGFKASPKKYTSRAVKKIISDPTFIIRKLRSKPQDSSILIDPKEQYQKWIKLNEPSQKDLESQRRLSNKLKYKPTISIITPVFNPPLDVFEELIKSVLDQTYPYWELCLGEFGQSKDVQDLIKKFAKDDKRIKYKFFTSNKGIAENSNDCFGLASGDYVALLDHDDTLSPDALYENASKLNEDKYDFIYSDKDKIDDKGKRFDPLFKPEWSPHLMYSANYLTHLNVMRKSLVEKVGKWDSSTDGAQDWDLFFKITERTNKIAHIPKVLYHWRVLETSTSLSIDSKPYALKGQINSLNYHLKRTGKIGTAYHTDKLMLAVKWPLDISKKSVAFILVDSVNVIPTIADRLSPLLNNTKLCFITSDRKNSSEEPDKYEIHYTEEKNKSKLLLELATKYQSEYIFIINQELTKLSSNIYAELTGWAKQPDIGWVAPIAFDSKRRFVGSMMIFGLGGIVGRLFKDAGEEVNDGIFGSPHWYRDATMLSTDMLCIQKSNFIKHFKCTSDSLEDNLQLSMIKLSKIKYNVLDTQTNIFIDKSLPSLPPTNDKIKLFLKEKDLCKNGDPYFNRNLSLAYLSPHLNTYTGDLEGLPLTGEKMLKNYFTEGVQRKALTKNLNEIDFIEKYDFPNERVKQTKTTNIKEVHWFLAGFDSVYAGLNNIFTFASYLAKNEGVENIFYIDTQHDISKETKLIRVYPELASAKVEKYNEEVNLPECDLAIATLWTTAFYVAKHSGAKKKAYFIQDDETLFYKPGSVSALVEASYQLGLIGIANTLGLKIMYENKYHGKALLLRSSVDLSKFISSENIRVAKKPYKVFFYGRPAHPRNGFELGVSALKKLKSSLGEDVYIMSAGADWDPAEYGLSGVVTNLGKLPMSKLPEFYKEIDAALFLMFSKHPGVVPSELMVSGCPVVVNNSSDETWNELYQDKKTAIVCLPTTSSIYNGLVVALTNSKLREKIISCAYTEVVSYYKKYEKEANSVIKSLKEL